MLVDQLEPLLILQERDRTVDVLKETLHNVPLERVSAEKGIESENAKLAASRQQLKQLEVERQSKEHEIAAAEEKVRKYLTQQMQVKKNEEYQALTHEIETVRKGISDLEDQVLGLMETIDQHKDLLKQLEHACTEQIALYQADLAAVQRREDNARAELSAAEAARDAAAAAVAAPSFRTFINTCAVRGRKPPVFSSSARQQLSGMPPKGLRRHRIPHPHA
ncbi:MAG: hypothetical protein LR015_09020 [Verrucomicrobia bacterium]|nr:hypothetical protein [Verrucomicrobiota bacterium]